MIPGTVTTAFFICFPRYSSAVSFILTRTIAEISSAWKTFFPSFKSTSMHGLLSLLTTLKGNIFKSRWTSLSVNLGRRTKKEDMSGRTIILDKNLLATNQSFGIEDGSCRIRGCLILCCITNQTLRIRERDI